MYKLFIEQRAAELETQLNSATMDTDGKRRDGNGRDVVGWESAADDVDINTIWNNNKYKRWSWMAERTFCVNLPLSIWWISSHSSVDPPRLLVHVEQRMEQSWEPTESHTYVAASPRKLATWWSISWLFVESGKESCLMILLQNEILLWWHVTGTYKHANWIRFYFLYILILVLPSNILTNQPVAFVLASHARLYGRHFCLFLCYRGNCKVLESPTPSCNIKVFLCGLSQLVIESVTNV